MLKMRKICTQEQCKEINHIVAEIYPDFDGLKDHGIIDVQKYFKDGVNEINKRSAPYKKVQIVKIRNEEFEKNTSKKIVRFKINRIVD